VRQYKDLSLDPATRTAIRNNRRIVLTTQEYALLEYRVRYPEQVLTRNVEPGRSTAAWRSSGSGFGRGRGWKGCPCPPAYAGSFGLQPAVLLSEQLPVRLLKEPSERVEAEGDAGDEHPRTILPEC
jgi:hypothetical protein